MPEKNYILADWIRAIDEKMDPVSASEMDQFVSLFFRRHQDLTSSGVQYGLLEPPREKTEEVGGWMASERFVAPYDFPF
jgi:hypothetical protein